MTRILVLTNMYPPHHLGGYELSCRDVMDRFRDRGHEITVLTTTMRLSDVADPPGEAAAGVRRELGWYWDEHRIVDPPLPRRLAMERANQNSLDRAIADAQPQVVSGWNMGAMSLVLLTTVIERGIPLVLHVADEWPVYAPRIDAWARLFVRRPRLGAVVRRIAGVPTVLPDLGRHAAFLYNSDMIRRRVEEASGWRPERAAVVYTGIDPRDFPPRRETRAREWSWRLLYVGRVDDRKGIHVAVDALTLLPDVATLDVVGRGDPAYLEQLREQVRRLGLDARVRFGVSDRERLKDVYAAADAVVFPALWEEPFGLVPVEAMACATPVVATGTGGSAEFLDDGVNCLRVPPGDAGALAGGLRRLADEPLLRARLVDGGLRTAGDLTVDRLAEVLHEWHVAAAEGYRSGVPAERRLVRG